MKFRFLPVSLTRNILPASTLTLTMMDFSIASVRNGPTEVSFIAIFRAPARETRTT